MANERISQMPAISSFATGDLLPIVDVSEISASDKNKSVTFGELFRNVLGGSASAPSIAFTGDQNTGIYSPGADQVAVATNGAGRLFVDSAGLVGIGTSSPTQSLTVAGNILTTSAAGTDSYINVATTGVQNTYLGFNNSGSTTGNAVLNNYSYVGAGNTYGLQLLAGGTPAITIDSSQRVGIGTTSPGHKLDLLVGGGADGVNVYNNATGAAYYQLATTSRSYKIEAIGADLRFYDNTGSTERARIDASGRLLIGTSSARSGGPYGTAGVQVESTSFSNASISAINNENTSDGVALMLGKSRGSSIGSTTIVSSGDQVGGVYFQGADGSALRTAASIFAEIDGTPGSNDMPGRLVFSTTADGASSPTTRMMISNDGSVTIGNNASLSYRLGLVVPSGADQSVFLAGVSGASNGLQVNWVNATSGLSVKFNNITTTASAANAFLDSADGNRIYRSTSSLRYKKNVENIDQLKADAILSLRPVWYRSKASNDRQDWSWYGLIAEEVAQVEPRLVHWTYLDEDYETETVNGEIKKTLKEGAQQVPDGVQYDRLTVLLLDVVKRQQQAIETLEAKVAALESA